MDQPAQNKTTEVELHNASTPKLDSIFRVTDPNPVQFVDTVLQESVVLNASDVLFEPRGEMLLVRARIDGVLYELGKVNISSYVQISSRIKVLSKLDPTEKRKVQEGQYTKDYGGRGVNFRVEVAQTIHGELIVIRIHERKTIVMNLEELGFNKTAFENYLHILKQRSGLILVCGPTGSGKTTTLYSTIMRLNDKKNYNVMTVEDPVEFQLDGVNQMQVQEEIGFTFAAGLRTLLRLSPDVMFVGEIRDRETAEIAVASGLTGQLVLSTIHAEDSVGAIFRLLDLGIEPYLLNSAVRGIVSQRLVRKICPDSKEAYQPTEFEIDLFQKVIGRPPKQLMRGKPSVSCNGLAYSGRIGIYEVLAFDAYIRGLIRDRVSEEELREKTREHGLITLVQDGLIKCEHGITSVDEVLKNSLRIE